MTLALPGKLQDHSTAFESNSELEEVQLPYRTLSKMRKLGRNK